MKKVIMAIGLPGTGKTTALKPFAERYGYTYISADEIRAELTGKEIDQSKNKEAWETVEFRLSEALADDQTVVVDATFANEKERQAFIALARELGAEKVQGVFTDVAFEVAHERNQQRERVVPEHAMKRMYNQLNDAPPEVEDGFDSVFDINEYQKLKRVEVNREGRIIGKKFL